MLQEAGSAWLVASRDEGYALERRLAEAVVASAREALDVEGPEEHLRRAWVVTYGLHPDAQPGVRRGGEGRRGRRPAGRDTGGDQGDAGEDGPGPSGRTREVGGGPCRSTRVRSGGGPSPHGRPAVAGTHGSTRHPSPVPVTQGGAAVHLAVVLVQWFATGVIRPT